MEAFRGSPVTLIIKYSTDLQFINDMNKAHYFSTLLRTVIPPNDYKSIAPSVEEHFRITQAWPANPTASKAVFSRLAELCSYLQFDCAYRCTLTFQPIMWDNKYYDIIAVVESEQGKSLLSASDVKVSVFEDYDLELLDLLQGWQLGVGQYDYWFASMLDIVFPQYYSGTTLSGKTRMLAKVWVPVLKQAVASTQLLHSPIFSSCSAYFGRDYDCDTLYNTIDTNSHHASTVCWLALVCLQLLMADAATVKRSIDHQKISEGKVREVKWMVQVAAAVRTLFQQLDMGTATAVALYGVAMKTTAVRYLSARQLLLIEKAAVMADDFESRYVGKWDIETLTQLQTAMIGRGCVPIPPGHNINIKVARPQAAEISESATVRFCVPIGTYYISDYKYLHKSSRAVLNRLFAPSALADTAHFNIRVSDVMQYALCMASNMNVFRQATGHAPVNYKIDLAKKDVIKVLREVPAGLHSQRASAIICNLLGLKLRRAYKRAYIWSHAFVGSPSVVQDRLKAMSLLLRRCAYLHTHGDVSDEVVAAMAYAELSSGRANNVSDWQQELKNRIGVRLPISLGLGKPLNHWNTDHPPCSKHEDRQFLKALRAKCKGIVEQMLAGYNADEDLSSFYKRRHEWMSSGSAAGYSLGKMLGDRCTDPELAKMRINKRVWADHTPFNVIKQALEGKPIEMASASEKFENGKARALYGVEPIHYIINTYATRGLEGRLKRVEGCEKGSSVYELFFNEKRRTKITARPEIECTMFDYADFNVQHTPEAQAMIFELIADYGEAKGFNPDWVKANRWVAKAKFNMRVKLFGKLMGGRVAQGMFSGTRSTDFINTILNIAYLQVASDTVRSSYGISSWDCYNVHQGDDVWVSNKNKLWARLIYYQLNKMGFKFQETKQMFGPQRGEYLRILFTHGKSLGYTQRALVNFILRPVQNDEIRDIRALAAMNNDSLCLLSRRGYTEAFCALLWLVLYSRWYVVRASKSDCKPVRVKPSIVASATWVGGLGNPMPRTFAWTQSALPPFPNLKWDVQRLRPLQGHMLDDWVQYISPKATHTQYIKSIDAEALKKAAFESNYLELARSSRGVAGMAAYKQDVLKYQQQLSEQPLEACFFTTVDELRKVANDLGKKQNIVMPSCTSTASRLRIALAIESDLTQKVPNVSAAPRLSHNMAKYEAGSIFKSIDATATALGVSRREAVIKLAHIDTSLIISNEDVAGLVLNRAQQGSDMSFDYLLGRQLGIVATMQQLVSQSFVMLVHSCVVDMLLRSNRFSTMKTQMSGMCYDAALMDAVCNDLQADVRMAQLMAY